MRAALAPHPGETTRRGLVLSGGGLRCAYQAGALRAFAEAGLRFDHIDATSGGGLNAAMLLSGLTPEEICARWRSLPRSAFLCLAAWQDGPLGTGVALSSADGIRRRVLPHLGIDFARLATAEGMTATFNVLEYRQRRVHSFAANEIDEDLLIAGMSLPAMLPPVDRPDGLWLDTAFVRDANPLQAVAAGCDELWLVWCLGMAPRYRGGPLALYVQMLEMAAGGALDSDLQRLRAIDERRAAGETVAGGSARLALHAVRPDQPLPTDDQTVSGAVDLATLVDRGHRDAQRAIAAATPSIPTMEAFLMSDPGPGITFRETMQGGFALGATDPEAGAAQGERDGTELAMHASITIDDLERFITDPEHLGEIVGSIDFPPLGMAIPADRGVFNLFSPTGDPHTKYMVYELGFTVGEKEYYVAGHKVVRDDPGFDLWSDTTTLYTTLHEGRDKSGTVVGAGVLSLGVVALTKLLTTVRAINTDSLTEKAKVIARFGTFFTKELYDSYVKSSDASPGGNAGSPAGSGRWDAIVIGSGFGGAVTACRLAQAGMKVLVLERGRRWDYTKLPREIDDQGWWWDHRKPEKHNGWLEMRLFPKVGVVQGAAVGGGSQIYANISVEAPPEAFASGWPTGIDHAALKPYYDRVAEYMDVGQVPTNQIPERTRLMKEGAEAIGAGDRFRQVDLAVSFAKEWSWEGYDPFDTTRSQTFTNRHGVQQGTCIHCGRCDIGCQVKAKNTLDLNYLAVAEQHGAEIRPLHQVSHLEPLPEGGYRVHVERLDGGRRQAGEETATRVVLAAGSLGSTELLLRCRDQYRTLRNLSPRLGYGWCSNGDFLTPAFYRNRDLRPSRGPTITSVIDFLDGSRGGHRFWVQDGGAPDLLDAWLQHYVDRKPKGWFQRLTRSWVKDQLIAHEPARNMMPWFAQGMDRSDGSFRLRRRWWLFGAKELRLDWDITRSEALMDTIVATHVELAKATGGTPLVPPTWSVGKYLVTPHPLGGCGMADSPERGVVDQKGEVFGHRGLYVIDGAMFPTSIGVNPSRTIAALAERCAEQIV